MRRFGGLKCWSHPNRVDIWRSEFQAAEATQLGLNLKLHDSKQATRLSPRKARTPTPSSLIKAQPVQNWSKPSRAASTESSIEPDPTATTQNDAPKPPKPVKTVQSRVN